MLVKGQRNKLNVQILLHLTTWINLGHTHAHISNRREKRSRYMLHQNREANTHILHVQIT